VLYRREVSVHVLNSGEEKKACCTVEKRACVYIAQ
jgi:hypothetical protein